MVVYFKKERFMERHKAAVHIIARSKEQIKPGTVYSIKVSRRYKVLDIEISEIEVHSFTLTQW